MTEDDDSIPIVDGDVFRGRVDDLEVNGEPVGKITDFDVSVSDLQPNQALVASFEDNVADAVHSAMWQTIVDGAGTDRDDIVSVTELVETDKDLLRESDGVLVGYSAVRSVGTPMEVMWAYERDYPVAVWLRDNTSYDDLSPWYRYHATGVMQHESAALSHLGYLPDEEPATEVER